VTLWQKDISEKSARKMLMKLNLEESNYTASIQFGRNLPGNICLHGLAFYFDQDKLQNIFFYLLQY